MNQPAPALRERRSDDAALREMLSPEIVKLLLLCGAEVRETDRSVVDATMSADLGDRRATERRYGDRRHLERRLDERRHDERRTVTAS